MSGNAAPEERPVGFLSRMRTLGLGLLTLAAGLVFASGLVISLKQKWGVILPVIPAAIIAGLIAMILGWRFLPRWWRPVLAIAPLGLVSLLYISPLWFLGAAVLLAAVQWNAVATRIPLYRSDASVAATLVQQMQGSGYQRFIDLGCGDGRLLLRMAKAMPGGRFEGVESAPILYAIARWRCRHQSNCEIHFGDFWKIDWGAFDLVFCFLSPEPMLRVWRKARREMAESGCLMSLAFEVPAIAASKMIGTPAFDLYEYRLSDLKCDKPN